MIIAAIDIGSNSIHLAIVGAERGQHLEFIDREKEMVRLGSGTLTSHTLSHETIQRAITTLRRFKQVAESHRVDLIIATATAAVREAHNADRFIELVREEVGLDIRLLPGIEEARLIALAVSEVTDFHGRRALVVDVGGGSTELAVTSGGEPAFLFSLRLGVVRLTEKYVSTDPISDQERITLVANIRTDLTRAIRELDRIGFDFVVGTSGTILDIVDAVTRSEAVSRDQEKPQFESFSQTITLDQLKRFNRKLVKMTLRERGRLPGIEKGRADIIVAGALLLETLLSEIGATGISSCDWSLREGVVLDHLRRHYSEADLDRVEIKPWVTRLDSPDELPSIGKGGEDNLDVRSRSTLSLARRYQYDAPHAHLVAKLATQIFNDTLPLHGMGPADLRLLQHAAVLHDIGYHIAHNNHHRHALYLIRNSDMPGFTGAETALMATVVRYHRGSIPRKTSDVRGRPEHEDFVALDRAQRATVRRLASILQIADGLDRSNRQLVANVRCEIAASQATFYIESEDDCELEIWSARRKSRWFSDIFGMDVDFIRVGFGDEHDPDQAPAAADSIVDS